MTAVLPFFVISFALTIDFLKWGVEWLGGGQRLRTVVAGTRMAAEAEDGHQ